MKQVLVKGGRVHLETVPPPAIGLGMALVRVSYSLISSGTESSFVSSGGTAAYALKKAKDPLNIEKVKRKLATVGVKGTLDIVRGKLLEFQAPGYSTSGVIVACGADVPGFRVGDRVACAGVGYACHAEFNAVPHQLLTPLPDGVDFDAGAFVALGAIAMQGVRRAQPTFGETIVVIGLGLVGLLAAQVVRAAGCRVIGCDPVVTRRNLALELGVEAACAPDELEGVVHEWSAGYGADAVIVCAASKDSAIANQAIDLCRPRGRVSVVGAVGMHLEREGLFRKEVDFSLSCSYGPGRYDTAYEENGLDYPIGHVRWTEGRNMAEFLRMVAEGKVRVSSLISRIDSVDDAASAYDAITRGDGDTIAALLRYSISNEDRLGVHPPFPPVHLRRIFDSGGMDPVLNLRSINPPAGSIGVAVVGAGAFAQAFHLPNLQRIEGCHLEAVAARTGSSAKQTGERFGARYCTTDIDVILADPKVHAVVIATRHNLHAAQALAALDAGKHVFVEKPMALTVADCEAICAKASETGLLVTVGYNRVSSPHARAAKAALAKVSGPTQVIYRCNAGPRPADHWSLDPEEGGGRILGEAVHFYDFCCWLLNADPVSVIAQAAGIAPDWNDLTTLLRFPDGSLATVIYCTTGSLNSGKERIEIYRGGGSIVIEDYRGVRFDGLPGKSVKPGREDKGQFGLLQNFIRAVRGEEPLEVTAAHGLRATRIALEALASARGTSRTNWTDRTDEGDRTNPSYRSYPSNSPEPTP
ncbi:MAG: bi-domain-containing oxidoreductase [Candidatus Hydrogenedentes bacterium]|nr:bi-domain-containing oxidoreductase [Candidatus Hydrogenedentota bacterium]